MGQKVNPVSLRLHSQHRHWDSSWYSGHFYKQLISKDVSVHRHLDTFLKALKLPSSRCSFQHFQKKTHVSQFVCFPKMTREWRAQFFGLAPGNTQWKRCFYKHQTSRKRFPKLRKFYTTPTTYAVWKQKNHITSFQNAALWSGVGLAGLSRSRMSVPSWLSSTPGRALQSQWHQAVIEKSPNQAPKTTQVRGETLPSAEKGAFHTLFVYKQIKSRVETASLISNPSLKYTSWLESLLTGVWKTPFHLVPFKVNHEWQCAGFLADEIVYFLEKRVPFRRLKSHLLKQFPKIPSLRGVRVTCSGRSGGKSKKAQRSKTECLKYGQTSLHVFSCPIDFSCKTAHTSFGSVGVKVWVCFH